MAYKQGFQPLELVFVLLRIGELSREWNIGFVLSMIDVPHAFDEMDHNYLFDCLLKCEIEEQLASWFIRDLRRTLINFRSSCGATTTSIGLGRSVPQGGKHSPVLFRVCMDAALHPVWVRCIDENVGWCMDGVRIPFIVFADNIWIMGNRIDENKQIYIWMKEALAIAGWSLPIDRMEWVTTTECGAYCCQR